ncbi:MAG TPA: aminotransferase class V-fold PLP-dependent enzyme, partial [Methanocorpusculum sp.]|nr:aminotransferase class V-fold PLP-dependent enzyme [Methanocorpusculum sp.]
MPSFDPDTIRCDFPILERLIYLDNAATSLSPRQVIEAQVTAEYNYRANVGRGIHRLSRMATHQYQEARETLKKFLGGEHGTLSFTKNTTESANIV